MKKLGFVLFITLIISVLLADGTEPTGNPREVSTLDHLLWISTNNSSWGDDFIQTADINASATAGWNGGAGFSPIGLGFNNWFTGSYDGQSHTIDGLYIYRPSTRDQGMFGYTYGAAIEDLGVINVDITGGNEQVGGLAGTIYNYSTVTRCYSTGSVNGDNIVGGLVGMNYLYSTISSCYSFCNVNGAVYVGGLLGDNWEYCTVSDSYSRGTVSGGSSIGGLCGMNYNQSIINRCYSTGNVSGGSNLGGLQGFNSNAHNWNSFWDTETSGQSTSTGGTGKTTVEMKDVATFTDISTTGLDNPWDFVSNPNDDIANDDFWSIDGITNDGYPFLTWQGSQGPTPVTLSSFTALQTAENFAQINWTTQSENGLIGYNVYRNNDANLQTALQINQLIIEGTNTTEEQNYIFTDSNVNFEQTYYYWLESVELDNETENFGPISLTIESPEIEELPETTVLSSAYPNPFRWETTIKFSIKENETAILTIYNVKGQKIVSENFQAGTYEYKWTAVNYTSGIYFYKLQTEGYSKINKMILTR